MTTRLAAGLLTILVLAEAGCGYRKLASTDGGLGGSAGGSSAGTGGKAGAAGAQDGGADTRTDGASEGGTQLPLGSACSSNGQCALGHCVDNVCCESACTGQCESCNENGNAGHCAVVAGVPRGTRTACAGTGACIGRCDGTDGTVCSFPGNAVQCTAMTCSNGMVTSQTVCNGMGACTAAVTTPCMADGCAADGTKCATSCSATSCGAGKYCNASGVCLPTKANGMSCQVTAECVSGSCIDNVCCDSTCAGQCQSCGESNNLGHCVTITGVPRGSRSKCGGTAACVGACNGASPTACTFPDSTVQCTPASCALGKSTAATTCNGAGACTTAAPTTCASNLCADASQCASTCAGKTCDAGRYCSAAGVCTPTKANGMSCQASAECANGVCVDNVCCDNACTGQCQSCGETNNLGHCVTVSGAPRGTRTKCAGSGACAGACDGASATACAFPGGTVPCAAASCSAGSATAATFCNGAGACTTATPMSCPSGSCADATKCSSSCSASSCGSGRYCDGNGLCQNTKANGATCQAAAECTNAHCIDNVCCDTACSGQCQSCGETGNVGKCVTVSGAPRGTRTRCAGTAPCAGACDGANATACAFPGGSTQCTAASCSNGSATTASVCNGAGACTAASATPCASGVCATSGPSCAPQGQIVWLYHLVAGDQSQIAIDGNTLVVAGGFGFGVNKTNVGGQDLTSGGDADIYLARYRKSDAAHMQSTRFGGTIGEYPNTIAIGPDGSVLVGGSVGVYDGSSATGKYMNLGGNNWPYAGTGNDVFFAEYTSGFAHRWSRRIGGPDDDVGANAIDFDSGGSAYVAARTQGTVDWGNGAQANGGATDGFYVRYDSAGTFNRQIAFKTWSFEGVSGALNVLGATVLNGVFLSEINLGNNSVVPTYTAVGALDSWVAAYDNAGFQTWQLQIGGTGNDEITRMAKDSLGRVYIAGMFQQTLVLGGKTLTSAGASDVFVARLSGAGAIDWVISFGGAGDDQPRSLAVSPNGDQLVVSGVFFGQVNFGNGVRTSVGNRDTYVAVFNGANGAPRWDRTFGSTADDWSETSAVDTDGTVYHSFGIGGAMDLGPPYGTITVSNTSFDSALVRLTK